MKKATQQQIKEHNRNLVLKTLLENDLISRADIARSTHLTRTTVSEIVSDLISESLIREAGLGSSSGGKSPILLGVVDDSRYLIGLDLAHNQFSGAIVNLGGELRETVSLPVNPQDGDGALQLVYEILDRLVEAQIQPLVGIGIGAPGLVNTATGVVVNAVNLDWKDLPLASLLEERYRMPVRVLNDSQAAALGEYTYGAERVGDENLIVVNARHGIGAGVLIDGRLFQGDGGGAGEIGHVVVVPEGGLLCRCGNYGCLETVASAQAIVTRLRTLAGDFPDTLLPKDPQSISLVEVEQAFRAGDSLTEGIVLDAGRYLGLALSGLVGILNIQNIVLTGDMTRFGEKWLGAIQDSMSRSTLFGLARDTRISVGGLYGNAIILGASALIWTNYSMLFNQ
ncbi:MAG TPA: ROK family transcriptional regulator [Anaerolineales bacterium]|nr:ROK family transcriptional regulator [Anaerolineales bacterium]